MDQRRGRKNPDASQVDGAPRQPALGAVPADVTDVLAYLDSPDIPRARPPHDFYAAYAMEFALAPDGMMTATLAVEHVTSSVDGGQGAADTITIEGPLSIVCRSGQTAYEFPVSPGVTANVRCGAIEEPETACDDTVNSGVLSGCSMRPL